MIFRCNELCRALHSGVCGVRAAFAASTRRFGAHDAIHVPDTDDTVSKHDKLWGGRFDKETDPEVEQFTESVSFDRRLYREDIRGSIAHAEMLTRCGLISEPELVQIPPGEFV